MLNEVKYSVPERFTMDLPPKPAENKWFTACYCPGRGAMSG